MTMKPNLFIITLVFAFSAMGFAETRSAWGLQTGAYLTQVRRSGRPPAGLYVQATSPAVLYNVQIALVLEVEEWGDRYGGVGLNLPFQVTEWFGFAGVSTFGYYDKGSRFDLGGPYQFRNGLDLYFGKVEGPGRLVIGYSHHSSSGLSQPNSGKESFRVGWLIQI